MNSPRLASATTRGQNYDGRRRAVKTRFDERRSKLRLGQIWGAFATNDSGVSQTRLRLTRLATTTMEDDDLRNYSSGPNFLEVASGSAYAPGSSLRRFVSQTRRCRERREIRRQWRCCNWLRKPNLENTRGEEPSKRRRRASRFDARSQNNGRRVIQQSFEPKEIVSCSVPKPLCFLPQFSAGQRLLPTPHRPALSLTLSFRTTPAPVPPPVSPIRPPYSV